jgi:His-Xaa-Ser system protein HxsD
MKSIFSTIEDGKILVSLSNAIYEKEAIMVAAYKMTDSCTILIEPIGNNGISVLFEPKEKQSQESLEKIVRDFCNEVLDQQVRLDLEKRYGKIRELIVEHAFSPIKDLKKSLDEL